jgi:hypothetical protein
MTHSKRTLYWILSVLLWIGWTGEALADFEIFYVNPEESRVRIDSARIEAGVPPNQTHLFDASDQAGLPGTTQGVLPGGGTSNGFETSLTGKLLVEDEIQSLNRLTINQEATTVIAGDMGSWLPGAAGQPAAEPANAAFQFTGSFACSPGAWPRLVASTRRSFSIPGSWFSFRLSSGLGPSSCGCIPRPSRAPTARCFGPSCPFGRMGSSR